MKTQSTNLYALGLLLPAAMLMGCGDAEDGGRGDQAGYTQIGLTADTKGRIFRWENAPKAIVQGLEGNLVIPLLGLASSNAAG